MEHGGRWRSGNKHVDRRVAADVAFSISGERCDLEDPTTTTTTATHLNPVSMSHLEQFTDGEWVEPSEEPQGTAVFDATGDHSTMPSWDELVRQHADRVYRLAYRLSGNQHDAEDLTQETFIRVFRSVQNYQPGTFEGWLHRITTNLFLDHARRKQRIRFDSLPDDVGDKLPGLLPSPAAGFDDQSFDADIEAALHELQPDFRVAVVLCDVEGLTYEEIAAVLDVKIGTVRSRIHRGRSMLRKALAHRAPTANRTRFGGAVDPQPVEAGR